MQTIKRYFLLISIGVILLRCQHHKEKPNIYLNEVIGEEVVNRLEELKLIDSNDTILGLWHIIINEAHLKSENYTFFTYNNLVQFYQRENTEPIITYVPIDSILDLRKEIESNLNLNRMSIKVRRFRGLTFNHKTQKDEVLYVNYSFFPPFDADIQKKEQFYELLLQTWINNPKYQELFTINSKLHNEDVKQTISDESNKLTKLKHNFEKQSVNTIYENNFLVVFLGNELALIRYNSDDEEFTVFNIITENLIGDSTDAMTVLSIYPIHKHGELELPFSDKGLTINSAIRYKTKFSKTIVENHFR
ncbi:hypothetical protein A3SI_19721 [Nitritalea halalkaliphila LW7]|uniref:Uncharacterized protein n=1 Tax=Nitritalea halalkaliphila LW7 TaxID=1189621 RepID=I5BSD6_9BACT|nr:hypothetical protein [Nitritalea halalkaliphila]EIM72488.1 hypothetical protein A3SI_19721 [Nitritalea halalkaliphila LW7]